jgi:hypothetical protein
MFNNRLEMKMIYEGFPSINHRLDIQVLCNNKYCKN